MKKRIYFIALSLIVLLSFAVIEITKKDKKSDNTKITVAEVTHSVFYTPWYVALEKGYFEEEGLDIDVILTPGADKVMAALLSGDAQIGFSGPEATIYVKEGKEKDYVVNFAALTKRDGQFIFGPCSEKENFKLENLKNKRVLIGRSGGMPGMVFLYALKQGGIDKKDINVDTSIEFASLSGAYISGEGDYVNLFDKSVTISN